jgi:hypothetical protein
MLLEIRLQIEEAIFNLMDITTDISELPIQSDKVALQFAHLEL